MEMRSLARRVLALVRALATVSFIVVVVPAALGAASNSRFGGRQPLHGVPAPSRWRFEQLQTIVTEELPQHTIADLVIRASLVSAWVAVLVFVVTVVIETVHMLRHGGHHLPDVRGLRWSQRGARTVAAGLLALVPLAQSLGAVAAFGDPSVQAPGWNSVDDAEPESSAGEWSQPSAPPGAQEYVVQPGDSVYAIAARLAGSDPAAVHRLADRIVDHNLGREMGNGERFTNAGYIDVGWVLQIPDAAGEAEREASGLRATAHEHVVAAGESLWSIAGDELGDPNLWPELYQANAGRLFGDGRAFHDPSIVQPGWSLHVPELTGASVTAPSLAEPADEPVAPVGAAPGAAHDAHHRDSASVEVPAHESKPVDTAAVVQTPVVDILGPAADSIVATARPENVWQSGHTSAVAEGDADVVNGGVVSDGAVSGEAVSGELGVAAEDSGPQLITVRRAAMLCTGIVTLLGVHRRRRLRSGVPSGRVPSPALWSSTIERTVRASGAGTRLTRVDLAVRAATMSLVDAGVRVRAVRCAADGEIELFATGPATLPSIWSGCEERWTLAASVPIELLADDARRVAAPCPALVQLGVDDSGGEFYVDLEALGALEIGGGAEQAEAIVAAIAATLASSVLAETTTLVSVAVPDDAFLGHRLHHAAIEPEEAFALAQRAVGPVATMESPIFELRARGTAGEPWPPSVVLFGAGMPELRPPPDLAGVAVVSASPIVDPSSRLVPEDGLWVLHPAGLRIRPIGLVPDDISTIGELVAAELVAAELVEIEMPVSSDDTVYSLDDFGPGALDGRVPDDDMDALAPASPEAAEWELLVRLFGPVEVVDGDGRRASFERSKTTELVAWLATHRDRSTRSNARTALWEQDVRDATFANVVSEARRALARLVAPPDGEEWLARTLTELLPLHALVVTDADLLERALAAARSGASQRSIDALRTAVESIAGLPFEGTAYLWPDAEGLTSRLILLATAAAAELATHCLSVGDVEGVFEATGRGLRVLPGHEELIALRMRAHAQAGDHAGVRQEWNSYERVINADAWSDGEPSPKLVHLRQQLLNPSL